MNRQPLSMWPLEKELEAARWLSLHVRELIRLRRLGKGPRYLTLPNDEIRYRIEDLEDWATSGGEVLHLYGKETRNVVAFPGRKIRRHLSSNSDWDDAS